MEELTEARAANLMPDAGVLRAAVHFGQAAARTLPELARTAAEQTRLSTGGDRAPSLKRLRRMGDDTIDDGTGQQQSEKVSLGQAYRSRRTNHYWRSCRRDGMAAACWELDRERVEIWPLLSEGRFALNPNFLGGSDSA